MPEVRQLSVNSTEDAQCPYGQEGMATFSR